MGAGHQSKIHLIDSWTSRVMVAGHRSKIHLIDSWTSRVEGNDSWSPVKDD